VSLRLRLKEVFVRGTWRPAEGGVTANIAAPAGLDHVTSWRAGRVIEAPMTFRRPARYLNDGVPDFEQRLALGGTTLFASIKSGLLVEVRARGTVVSELAARVRGRTRRALASWVSPRRPATGADTEPADATAAADVTSGNAETAAAIVTAVLIGDRGGIPDDVRERLQAAGTYHVIAISGGNIAMFVALTVGVLRAARISGRPAAATALLVLALYGQVASAGPSVWRATVMASLHLAARALDQEAPSWQVTAIAVAGMLIVHPLDLIDPAFQLTVGATAALLYGAGWVRYPAPRRAGQGPPAGWAAAAWTPVRWLVAGLLATLAVEVALLPVAALTFSRVTAAGLPLNLVAVPLMAVTQVAGMVTVAADTLGLPASAPGWIARLAAQGLVETAHLVDVAPWLVARVPAPPLALVAAYYAACGAMVFACSRPRGFGAGTLSACVVAITAVAMVTGTRWPGGQPGPALRVTMLDVGQGASILIETPDGAVLVDAGGPPFGASRFDIGGRVVAPALWARGIRRLAALVVTHGDPDHVGGAMAVLRDFAPRELWVGIDVPGHQPTEALLREASARGIRVTRRRAGESLSVGPVSVRVLHPTAPDWERRRVRNDDSVVLELVVGQVAVLLTGDIGAAVEDGLVAQLTRAPARVLQAAHHGSRTSSSAALIDGWRPQTVLISCGRGNTFGHPAPDVLGRLAGVGSRVLRTDRDGQVTLETDGVRVWTRTYSPG
jgi:competence protein ComEC